MRAERQAKLADAIERSGLDGLLLLGTNTVSYATGALAPGVDSGLASVSRGVALVLAGDPVPHLWTPYPDGAPVELARDHLHPDAFLWDRSAAATFARTVRELLGGDRRLACDELTHPLMAALSEEGIHPGSAAGVMGTAKLCKTVDELACIRAAQRINEAAMAEVYPLLQPGVRQSELTGTFLRAAFELGATSNCIDPIWQVMPASHSEGPWTTHGGVAFPTASGLDRVLRDGDVVWVDTGLGYCGYASDFGRTWVVGGETTARQRAQFERWGDVMRAVLALARPGVAALDLARAATAANGGVKPWIDHFYLAHGVGTDSAEMPLIGTDLGEAFDEALVLRPGMVAVLEPVIWDDGAAGYRSEDIVAVTDDGWEPLSSFPYDPFEGSWDGGWSGGWSGGSGGGWSGGSDGGWSR